MQIILRWHPTWHSDNNNFICSSKGRPRKSQLHHSPETIIIALLHFVSYQNADKTHILKTSKKIIKQFKKFLVASRKEIILDIMWAYGKSLERCWNWPLIDHSRWEFAFPFGKLACNSVGSFLVNDQTAKQFVMNSWFSAGYLIEIQTKWPPENF